ncbi:chemotaxis protein [Shewanella sp. 10N.286.51.B2]|uniref:chemotaxis protein n=1 Tax=Shewanella sp. 10N.286.51.B2 TaxID=3229707 RepID=UPI003553E300
MEIASSFTLGVQGLQQAHNDLAQATTAVAIPETLSSASLITADSVTLSSQAAALIDAQQAISHAEVAVDVINVWSENIGTIIDVSV